VVILYALKRDYYFHNLCEKRAKSPLQVRITDNSIMSHNEVIERLSIDGHSVLIEKLSKAYAHQKVEFTRSQRDEKAMCAQRKVALTISLLELSIKEQITEQQEQLCKELNSDNKLKFSDKDNTFAKITFLSPNTIIRVKQMVYIR